MVISQRKTKLFFPVIPTSLNRNPKKVIFVPPCPPAAFSLLYVDINMESDAGSQRNSVHVYSLSFQWRNISSVVMVRVDQLGRPTMPHVFLFGVERTEKADG